MIPLRDSTRSRTTPWVTWLLIAANVLVFLYELGLRPKEQAVLSVIYGVVPARYSLPGFPAGPAGLFLPLVTAMFLHGGWLHLLGNMIYLWVFGDNVEDRMGHGRFLTFYLLVGLLANLAHIYFNPLSEVPTIGASGAIAGVLGAYFISFPRARVLTLVPIGIFLTAIEVPALLLLLFWFLLQLVSGLFAGPAQTVAWWAHVGGFIAGAALAGVFRRRRNPWLV
ncbi:MAG: rhomboid family intramembrane serine protease [Firmicutes bacterium]|nr:rhomboid family intramembrane serine protease [Bacillota bacterium]